MSTPSVLTFEEPSNLKLVSFRVLGHAFLATIVLALPALGDQRYYLAGFILFIAAPVVAWLGVRYKDPAYCWIDPLTDLSVIVIASWLIPYVWPGAFCLGLMVALSPSVSLHPRSNLIYAAYGGILLLGMGGAYVVRAQHIGPLLNHGWLLAGVAAVYPSLIVYANWQRQRSAALQERAHLLTAVTDLSGSVAHDFNNVLMAISGHAELARLELPDNHPAHHSLQEVINGTSRASLLCGQLLAFAGKEKHTRATLDLTVELQTIVGLLRPALPAGVNIQIKPHMSGMYVYGERSELQQVLLNVIVNAGEAMALTGGMIDVSVERTSYRLRREVVVTIRDQGKGIAAGALRRIYDPFYTTKDRGHGLGLASVKRIMKAHAGDIEIDSEPGRGTRVTLRWPETRSEKDAPATPEKRPSRQEAASQEAMNQAE